jgi:polyhydroxyalkanoate synthesis regulator phasin
LLGAQADRIEEEKYARRTNDNELQEQIDELKTIIKDLSSNKRK